MVHVTLWYQILSLKKVYPFLRLDVSVIFVTPRTKKPLRVSTYAIALTVDPRR